MIAKDVLNAMQMLKQAQQLDPYRSHLNKLNDAIVKMDDEISRLEHLFKQTKWNLRQAQDAK